MRLRPVRKRRLTRPVDRTSAKSRGIGAAMDLDDQRGDLQGGLDNWTCSASLAIMKTLRRPPKEPLTSDLEIIEIGGKKVLAHPSNSTATAVAVDFAAVEWGLRQIAIVSSQSRSEGAQYGPDEIRSDFKGKRVLDFADDSDLAKAALGNSKASVHAAEVIARTTGLSAETVLQYAKRVRIGGKNQRKVMHRTGHK